jgi:hypothetical protein
MTQLEDLLEELDAHRSASDVRLDDGRFVSVYSGLLLVHRLGESIEDPSEVMRQGRLVLRRAGHKSGRAEIGTDECVFCSVGVAPYWEPPVVLVFGPLSILTEGRLVVPWDSRGAATQNNHLGLRPSEIIARYSLRFPDDEAYVPKHLATCFETLESFLEGRRPVRPDPAGVLHGLVYERPVGDLTWLQTPEARYEVDLEVSRDNLRAVFVDHDALQDAGLRRSALALQRLVQDGGGVHKALRRSAGAVDYRSEVSQFVAAWLQQEGWI